MKVLKRNGILEDLDFSKIEKVVKWACDGINGVYPTQLLMRTKLSIVDGISTKNIHEYLIRAAYDLLSANVNYTYVASRLAFYMLYKELYGSYDKPTILEHYLKYKDIAYCEQLETSFTKEEWDYFNTKIDHNRDFKIAYPGFKQWLTKYLIQDRVNNTVFETPQMALMLLSMKMFEKSSNRKQKIVDYYDAVSQFKINLSTPILAGVRGKTTQFSSCVLIDMGDSIKSIAASHNAVMYHIANRAGIGLNYGRVRSLGSKIRNGEAVHTGKIPFMKMTEGAVKSCSQGGTRGGAATITNPIWDIEIFELAVLKNNQGTEDSRVRKIDYCFQFSRIFYERYLKNGNITLFSTSDVPGLYEAFGDNEKFDALYEYYENLEGINKKVVNAKELIHLILQQRLETGRIYISNIDHVNSHSSFLEMIKMTNLCVEITLVTKPFETENDLDGEIALCILSAITAGFVTLEEVPTIMPLIVESLDNIVDMQSYLMPQAEKMRKRRSLGIGINGLAHLFAKNKCEYGSQKSMEILDEFVEAMTYYGIKASIELAKERGACEYYDKTKYSKGLFPIDTRYKKFDDVFPHAPKLDWEWLRNELSIYGIRNSTLFAQMPCESSSVATGTTNGDQPTRSLITSKSNKSSGVMRTVVPEYETLANYYTLAFDIPNEKMNRIAAIIQKYFDQAMSVNHYYKKNAKTDNISLKDVVTDVLTFYKYGGKNLYYANTNDEKTDEFVFEDDNCESGACAL